MKALKVLMMSFCIFLLFSLPAMAQENLDDWFENVWQGEFSSITMGTSARLSASGQSGETWGTLYNEFPGSTGMLASFNVSAISTEANSSAAAGIQKPIGYLPNGNRIIARIYLDQWSNSKRITYRIREWDVEKDAYAQDISRGHLGDLHGTWKEGQEVLIAFLFLNNEVWFASSISGAFVKVMFLETLVPTNLNSQIFAYTSEGSANSIEVTVSHVLIF